MKRLTIEEIVEKEATNKGRDISLTHRIVRAVDETSFQPLIQFHPNDGSEPFSISLADAQKAKVSLKQMLSNADIV